MVVMLTANNSSLWQFVAILAIGNHTEVNIVFNDLTSFKNTLFGPCVICYWFSMWSALAEDLFLKKKVVNAPHKEETQ